MQIIEKNEEYRKVKYKRREFTISIFKSVKSFENYLIENDYNIIIGETRTIKEAYELIKSEVNKY